MIPEDWAQVRGIRYGTDVGAYIVCLKLFLSLGHFFVTFGLAVFFFLAISSHLVLERDIRHWEREDGYRKIGIE